MKRNLFLRTDILPREIPLMYSNKNLYLPFTEKKMKDKHIEKIINCNKTTTVPYYFYIPKNNDKKRKMSLLHPLAQLQSFSYILRYEQMITAFCSRSPYSIRSPLKRNMPKYNHTNAMKKRFDRKYAEFSLSKDTSITSDEDEDMFLNYFSYKKYKRISELYNSFKFKKARYKYKYFVKLDIQNFFPSIYTHSFAWAIFGNKSIGKIRKEPNLFANATDRVCQKINFNETNGLITGPEFSRVMAELLLTQVDTSLFRQLYRENNKTLNKDYIIYRFVDDYFIFTQDIETAKIIEDKLDKLLDEYNLLLNTNKKEIQVRPFKAYSNSIIELKKSLKEFRIDKYFTWLELKKKNYSNDINHDKFDEFEIRGKKKDWDGLFEKVERIIYEDTSSSQKVVNYFLKAIQNSITYDGSNPWNTINMLEIAINIYSLNINYDSTNHIIAIVSKINNKCIKLLTKLERSKSDLSSEESVSLEVIETKINNITIVKNNLFQSLYITVENNFESMELMYDLLILFKTLGNSLSSQFLCKTIKQFPNSYFILCSVAYYIQNEELDEINPNYLTVLKNLRSAIYEIKDNYISQGSHNKLLEGAYFYIINDFSFYPGFIEDDRKALRSTIEKGYKEIKNQNSYDEDAFNFIWESITKRSYYKWHEKTGDFLRKIIMKSTYNYRNLDSDNYTF